MGIRTTFNSMGGVKIASGVAKVTVGGGETVWVLMQSGDLYGCGYGGVGQQGNGSTNVLTFTKRASNVTDFACSGSTTWYINSLGELYGCGLNGSGQQGNGSTSNVLTFHKRANNVAKIACSGSATWYIDNSGDLYGCGANTYGQQGSGNTTTITMFTKRASNVKDIVCSTDTTWYIDTSGYLYGCGRGNRGQQGNGSSGSTNNIKTFTYRASNIIDVVCSNETTWYINSSGQLYGCGYSNYGQQGAGAGETQVKSFTQRASSISNVVCSNETTWYINSSGQLYGCGSGYNYQQGNNSTSDVKSFTRRAYYVEKVVIGNNTNDVVNYSTAYINQSKDLYFTGYLDNSAQGSTYSSTEFIKRASNVIDFAYAANGVFYYIDSNNNLWGCGAANLGQQGNGYTNALSIFSFENKMQYLTT